MNECIDRARGRYLARMDADDIAYPDRLARQLAFLLAHAEVDLCAPAPWSSANTAVRSGASTRQPDHAGITRSPFRGFPLWHPLWMGHIEWFRRWRYEESAWLAQDQELLLRSYRLSRFANLPQVLLGYRRERITLKKLLRYKVLHIRYVCKQPGVSSWRLGQVAATGVSTGEVCRQLRRSLRRLRAPPRSSGCASAFRRRARGVAQSVEPARRLVWAALERDLPPCVAADAGKESARAGMKIVHVLTRGDVLGGAQSHVRELSLELRNLGHDVTVITGAPGIFTDQLRQAGIPWLGMRSLVRPVRPHRDVAALVELWCALRQLKPDLVCAHTAKAGSLARAAARLHHIPSVFTPHGWSMFDRTSLRTNPLFCWAERWQAGSVRVSSTFASMSVCWHSDSASARQRRWRWCITA